MYNNRDDKSRAIRLMTAARLSDRRGIIPIIIATRNNHAFYMIFENPSNYIYNITIFYIDVISVPPIYCHIIII